MPKLKALALTLWKQRGRAVDYLALAFSFLIVQRFNNAVDLPEWFLVSVAAILLFVSAPSASPQASILQRLAVRLRNYALTSGLMAVLAYASFRPPLSFYLVAPIWVALAEVARIAVSGDAQLLVHRPLTALPGWLGRALGLGRSLVEAVARPRLDLAVTDAAAVAITTLIGWHMVPATWPLGRPLAIAVGGWAVANLLLQLLRASSLRATLARTMASLLALGICLGLALRGAEHLPGIALGVVFCTLCLAVLSLRALAYRYARHNADPVAENLRWLGIAGIWVLLFYPFFFAVRHGTGDAQWYATMTADMIAQVRSGVFPVFAGQSEYQFNGAIYPLRVAPLFLYLGALVDTLTLHQLEAYGVQNLTLALVGLFAFATAYFTLGRVLPRLRWVALGLATIFIACPGTLGVVYNTDLYMSWTTLAFVPLAMYGMVRFFQSQSRQSLVLLGGALGGMWWGHSPIAMWSTLFGGFVVALRLALSRPDTEQLKRYALGAVAFAAVAAYPLLSVLAFPVVEGEKATSFQRAYPGAVAMFVSQVFPKVLLPVSDHGRSLSDFQLGFSLWLILILCAVACIRTRSRTATALMIPVCALVLLLTPIPQLNLLLWSLVPNLVRNTTGNWAMNRLYLVTDAFLIYAFAVALRESFERGVMRRASLYSAIAIMVAWSLFEGTKFAAIDQAFLSRPEKSTELNKENVMATQFAYLVFPKTPDYFTHGVTDPQLENRLLSPADQSVLVENTDIIRRSPGTAARLVRTLTLAKVQPGAGADYLNESPVILEPGKHYLAHFDFQSPEKASGVLILKGPTFFRQYALPEYGSARSFGVGGKHSSLLALETSERVPEPLSLQFVPKDPQASEGLMPQVQVYEYDPAALAIRMESWIPYRARVTSTQPALLETPRLYQTGYRAWVNGAPAAVRMSQQGLAMVSVPSGNSEVTLSLSPPFLLQATFWLSLLSALALGGFAVAHALKAGTNGPT